MGTEGCLSVPGIVGEVERHEAVTVKALNRRGQPVTIKAKGWLARIFQHEIDHLEGCAVHRPDRPAVAARRAPRPPRSPGLILHLLTDHFCRLLTAVYCLPSPCASPTSP